jgi:hypothetical protein
MSVSCSLSKKLAPKKKLNTAAGVVTGVVQARWTKGLQANYAKVNMIEMTGWIFIDDTRICSYEDGNLESFCFDLSFSDPFTLLASEKE